MVTRLGPAARGAGLPHATAKAALASASRRKVIDGPFGQARLSRTMPDIRRNSSCLALGYSRPTRFHNQASRIVRLRRSGLLPHRAEFRFLPALRLEELRALRGRELER